jgi:hypothetical protein
MRTYPPSPEQHRIAKECGFILNPESVRLCRRVQPNPADFAPTLFTADVLPNLDLSPECDLRLRDAWRAA